MTFLISTLILAQETFLWLSDVRVYQEEIKLGQLYIIQSILLHFPCSFFYIDLYFTTKWKCSWILAYFNDSYWTLNAACRTQIHDHCKALKVTERKSIRQDASPFWLSPTPLTNKLLPLFASGSPLWSVIGSPCPSHPDPNTFRGLWFANSLVEWPRDLRSHTHRLRRSLRPQHTDVVFSPPTPSGDWQSS